MDAIQICDLLDSKIRALDGRDKVHLDAVKRKAAAQVEYDKALRNRIIELRADGHPISIVEKIAKGDIWEKTLELELSEGLLKGVEMRGKEIMAQLNGIQTHARILSE